MHALLLLLLSAALALAQDAVPTAAPPLSQPAPRHLLDKRQATTGASSTSGVSIPNTAPVTPTSLTFEARCSANGFTYPVGVVPGSQTSLVWDPYEYAQSPNAIPFAQASYTLRVYDERGADATAEAGRFNGNNAIINFAMYSPAAYTPMAQGWTCAGCSAAVRTVGAVGGGVWAAVAVSAAAVLIGGAGVLGR
ncbi:hypothetical protein JCM10450v2_002879 [Rhodotorula kratochvilovae]